jgi:DNA-binding MarR family transcriptional regulator
MTDIPLLATLRLLRSASLIEEKTSGAISAAHGLSLKEVFLLMHLESETGQRLTRVELSRRLHMSASTVTRMTAPLEKIGLVARDSDPRDARLAFVVLTDAGKTRIAEVRVTLREQVSRIFQDRWSEYGMSRLSDFFGWLVADPPSELA